MTKEQIIEALKYHEVPEKKSDIRFIEEQIEEMYDCFYDNRAGSVPIIELNNVCFDTYDEWFRAEFNVINTINGKTISTTIEEFDELYWNSHEELADQLLEIEAFASKLRIVTTDELGRRENIIDTIVDDMQQVGTEWVIDNLSELSQEIMSVKI